MLSRSSTSETHTGHREPCERFRRRQAESGNRLTECDLPVIERWRHNSAFRKCDDCKTATREQAKIRRTAKRKAKMAARKQEVQKKRRFQEHGIMASATSIEAAEETDQYVNTLPPMQAQEFMIHQFNTLPPMQAQQPMIYPNQDTIVKSEPQAPPRYAERQREEAVAWDSIPDRIAWEASLRHEAAQFQPKETEQDAVAWSSRPDTISWEASLRHEAAHAQPKEAEAEEGIEIKEERNSTTSISPLAPIHVPTPPPPPTSYPLCTCAPHPHKFDTIHECARKADELYDVLFLDQFITNAFEYDPTWRAECGAVMSMKEQGMVWRWFLGVVEVGFGEVGGLGGFEWTGGKGGVGG